MLWLLLIPFAAAFLAIGIVIWRDVLARRAAFSSLNSISQGTREDLLQLIEGIGTAPSKGTIGLISNFKKPNGRLALSLPGNLDDFPWAGQTVTVRFAAPGPGPNVQFELGEPEEDCADIRWLTVPALWQANGKRSASVYSVNRYLRLSEELHARVRDIHGRDPALFVSCLLSADRRHPNAEPFDALRCGLPPAWVQSARFHRCAVCSKPMRLILQVPGFLLGSRAAEGCFYFFGCKTHPDQTVQDEDWF